MRPRKTPVPNPGTVKKACACGSLIGMRATACDQCWPKLPPHLQKSWRDAKYGEYSEAALERAGKAINAFLKREGL